MRHGGAVDRGGRDEDGYGYFESASINPADHHVFLLDGTSGTRSRSGRRRPKRSARRSGARKRSASRAGRWRSTPPASPAPTGASTSAAAAPWPCSARRCRSRTSKTCRRPSATTTRRSRRRSISTTARKCPIAGSNGAKNNPNSPSSTPSSCPANRRRRTRRIHRDHDPSHRAADRGRATGCRVVVKTNNGVNRSAAVKIRPAAVLSRRNRTGDERHTHDRASSTARSIPTECRRPTGSNTESTPATDRKRPKPRPGPETGSVPVAPIEIDNLQPGRRYHFRLVAKNGLGETHGPGPDVRRGGSPDDLRRASLGRRRNERDAERPDRPRRLPDHLSVRIRADDELRPRRARWAAAASAKATTRWTVSQTSLASSRG